MASTRRRRFGWTLGLMAVAVVAIAALWMVSRPPPPPQLGAAAQAASEGFVSRGPAASTSMTRPGSQTYTRAGTDSRDNGTSQAGRAAPATTN